MDADVTPDDVETTGIENVTKEMIDDAAARGNVIKLICRAYRKNGEVILKVAPEEVNKKMCIRDRIRTLRESSQDLTVTPLKTVVTTTVSWVL